MKRSFNEDVERVISALRPGEVASYSEIAEEAGYPGAARAVGNLLSGSADLPWWRVVAADGRLVPGHQAQQAELLRSEGVAVNRGKVKRR